MKYQESFLKAIRSKIAKSASVIDEIATVLEISYDASHRRISGKSKFSIDETIKLADHFNISLDNLFSKKEKVIVEKTIEIETLKDMLHYFKTSAEQIEVLTKNPKTTLFYSAKDIPLFYFMDGTILSKFKAFVWLNLLNSHQKKVAFESFIIEESFAEYMQKLKSAYENTIVNEIWNDTTINSSLQQILYFHEAGLLSLKNANALCKDLKRIINLIQEKCNMPNNNFNIYYNELILLNNNMLIETEEKLTMFVPYTLLGYFITDNEESCRNVHQFFKQQIINSKPLGQSGIKEQNLFFNRAIRKIDYYIEKINSQVDLLF
ncbi:helix-turn-helix domain-containing protein [Flavobacterium sp. ov086]|uniref:helix-turn-helix domain-containing protein n=1 Tax=Flavobacterium sp. ov086 TaxID=1761785 RepID=UPI000B768C13|nr:helix-turn-helix domain-containing protein [Flavobacterium sp. ov086]SNR22639.1 BetR domain-containing protein [Flavobacterium sp. ov086]